METSHDYHQFVVDQYGLDLDVNEDELQRRVQTYLSNAHSGQTGNPEVADSTSYTSLHSVDTSRFSDRSGMVDPSAYSGVAPSASSEGNETDRKFVQDLLLALSAQQTGDMDHDVTSFDPESYGNMNHSPRSAVDVPNPHDDPASDAKESEPTMHIGEDLIFRRRQLEEERLAKIERERAREQARMHPRINKHSSRIADSLPFSSADRLLSHAKPAPKLYDAADCCFAPKVCASSEKMDKTVNQVKDRHAFLYQKALVTKARLDEWRQNVQNGRIQDEENACTFKPDTSQSEKTCVVRVQTADLSAPVLERLTDWDDRRKERILKSRTKKQEEEEEALRLEIDQVKLVRGRWANRVSSDRSLNEPQNGVGGQENGNGQPSENKPSHQDQVGHATSAGGDGRSKCATGAKTARKSPKKAPGVDAYLARQQLAKKYKEEKEAKLKNTGAKWKYGRTSGAAPVLGKDRPPSAPVSKALEKPFHPVSNSSTPRSSTLHTPQAHTPTHQPLAFYYDHSASGSHPDGIHMHSAFHHDGSVPHGVATGRLQSYTDAGAPLPSPDAHMPSSSGIPTTESPHSYGVMYNGLLAGNGVCAPGSDVHGGGFGHYGDGAAGAAGAGGPGNAVAGGGNFVMRGGGDAGGAPIGSAAHDPNAARLASPYYEGPTLAASFGYPVPQGSLTVDTPDSHPLAHSTVPSPNYNNTPPTFRDARGAVPNLAPRTEPVAPPLATAVSAKARSMSITSSSGGGVSATVDQAVGGVAGAGAILDRERVNVLPGRAKKALAKPVTRDTNPRRGEI